MTPRNPSRLKWLQCFIPHRLELLTSPAWNAAPAQLRRMIERLEVEHLRHGGMKNGNLFVSYSKFSACGISRRQIRGLTELGQGLGLLECRQDVDASNGRIRPPNAYRLTYVPEEGHKAPTDEWRSVTEKQALTLLDRFRARDTRSRSRQDADRFEDVA